MRRFTSKKAKLFFRIAKKVRWHQEERRNDLATRLLKLLCHVSDGETICTLVGIVDVAELLDAKRTEVWTALWDLSSGGIHSAKIKRGLRLVFLSNPNN